MKTARSFGHDVYEEDFEIDLKNLLHLTIQNTGTTEIKVDGKGVIKPNGYFNIPASADLPMEAQKLKFTNVESAYITSSYLIGKSC